MRRKLDATLQTKGTNLARRGSARAMRKRLNTKARRVDRLVIREGLER